LNLAPENELVPSGGVYVSRISLDGSEFWESVTNVGTRPTFAGNSLSIETFVLGRVVPEGTLRARLQFLRRLRDERKFDSPELLREQIGRDIHAATRFFRLLRPSQTSLRRR
jgi:riboflavin kinase/FMN adenylyltransferase